MSKKNMAIASLVLAILSLIPIVIAPSTLDGVMIFTAIFVLIAVVAIILGFIGKSEKKGIAIAGIVIGIVSCVLLGLAILGYAGMKNVTNCVDQGNGISKCEYMGQVVDVPTSFLTEDQMKK